MTDRVYKSTEDQILDRYNNGELSYGEAQEQLLILQERHDDARRRQEGA